MKPQRIQLSRKRGWRKPANTVVVSRPSKWGNPYTWSVVGDPEGGRRAAVEDYKRALELKHLPFTIDDAKRELRGKNLACWCPSGSACHADVLLEVANA